MWASIRGCTAPFCCERLSLRPSLSFCSRRHGYCCMLQHRAQSTRNELDNSDNRESDNYSNVIHELRFYSDNFAICEENVHYSLLTEANRKHGVFLNVPPQLPPVGSPPAVCEVVYCSTLRRSLTSGDLAYTPTHAPPPLSTTGRRGLSIPTATASVGAPNHDDSSARGRTAGVQPVKLHASASTAQTQGTMTKEYTTPILSLPEDFEIALLLREVWDVVGRSTIGQKFRAHEDVVVGLADKRDETTQKVDAQATPLGVAPALAQARDTTVTGAHMSVAAMSARFPNPLGADAFGASGSLSDGRNPFLSEEDVARIEQERKDATLDSSNAAQAAGVLRNTVPNSSTARSVAFRNSENAERRFMCHICGQKCRILDSLHTHYAEKHDGATIPDHLLRQYISIRPMDIIYKYKIPRAHRDGMKENQQAGDDAQLSAFSADSEVKLIPDPAEEHEISVHMRAAQNITLIGDVVEVQRGFRGHWPVTQFVVCTIGITSEEPSNEFGQDGETCVGNGVQHTCDKRCMNQSTELIPIRCFGSEFNNTYYEKLTAGCTVIVCGCLKNNYHFDEESKKRHAYPFVKVMQPLGYVTLLS